MESCKLNGYNIKLLKNTIFKLYMKNKKDI